MVIGKREQKNPEQKLCAQVSMLCRQKLLGYAESFEELGRSFHDEARIVGDDRQSILEKCLLQQSRQVMGDHLQTVARIMEQVAGEEMCYRPVEEKRRKNLVQALHSEGIAAAELCYIRKKGAAANGISMILSTERSGCKASQAADMLTVLLGKHLQPSPGSPYLIEREPHCFQFTEEPKYVALTGVSRAVKEGEKIFEKHRKGKDEYEAFFSQEKFLPGCKRPFEDPSDIGPGKLFPRNDGTDQGGHYQSDFQIHENRYRPYGDRDTGKRRQQKREK